MLKIDETILDMAKKHDVTGLMSRYGIEGFTPDIHGCGRFWADPAVLKLMVQRPHAASESEYSHALEYVRILTVITRKAKNAFAAGSKDNIVSGLEKMRSSLKTVSAHDAEFIRGFINAGHLKHYADQLRS